MTDELIKNRVTYGTVDPNFSIDGRPVPALTTLLHNVCGNDPKRFEEACRVVDLFVDEAIKQTRSDT